MVKGAGLAPDLKASRPCVVAGRPFIDQHNGVLEFEGHTNHLDFASAAEITFDLINPRAVAGHDPLQPAGGKPRVEFDGGAARDLIGYRVRNEDLGVQLTEQL